MKSINKLFIPLLLLVAVAGCKKSFLDRPSQSQIASNNFYQTTKEIRLATANLYGGAPWWQWHSSGFLQFGDVLSGNGTTGQYQGTDNNELFAVNLSASNGYVQSGWTGLYNIIGQCNNTILGIQQYAPATVTTIDKNAAIAEARFIRGYAYFNLVLHWGAVPIVEDNSKLIDQPLLNRIVVPDVYKFVTNDLTYAVENLPATDVAGRVTTWSAQGMLSKVYLTMAGLGGTRNQAYLDSAKKYAGNVCKNSGKTLFPSYYDLFKVQNNDVPEVLFAYQWAAGTGYGNGNTLNNYAPSNTIMPKKGGAWASMKPTYDLYLLYTEIDTVRRKATFMVNGDYYPELNAAEGGFKATGSSLKKHIIGNDIDNSSPLMDLWSSPEHDAVLRLADVYMIYAEAIMGSNTTTSDPDALVYYNKVRTRAGVDPLSTITLDTLISERRIEFAFEGNYWGDLVRLSYWQPAKALAIVNAQNRSFFSYAAGVATPDPSPVVTVLPATASSFTLQIPATELTANPKLTEAPVKYY
ncbi:MAG: RagB/SusD family nutrient uptake outer membrane protein [Chitinophagaceae bacterium]